MAMDGLDSYKVGRDLESTLVGKVKEFSKAQRCTPFYVHLAAFKTVLFCLAGEECQDLTIGFADAARNDDNMKNSLNFFLKLLTLRFKRHSTQISAQAIVEARQKVYAALESSRLPFDVLLSELNVARLAQFILPSLLGLPSGCAGATSVGHCQLESHQVHSGRTAYDITLDITEWSDSGPLAMIRVQENLYDTTAANLLLETYVHSLDALSSNTKLAQDDIPLFSEEQLANGATIARGPKLISDWQPTLP